MLAPRPKLIRKGRLRTERQTALTGSFRKLVHKLGAEEGSVTSPAPKRRKTSRRDSPALRSPPSSDVTGQTIFGDRPLRFRNFTLSEGDLLTLGKPSALESAFKIRVAKLSGPRREAGI